MAVFSLVWSAIYFRKFREHVTIDDNLIEIANIAEFAQSDLSVRTSRRVANVALHRTMWEIKTPQGYERRVYLRNVWKRRMENGKRTSGECTDGRTTIEKGKNGRRGRRSRQRRCRLLTRHVSVVSRTRSKTALASANPRIGPFNARTRFRDYKYQRYREADPGEMSRLQMKLPTLLPPQ